MENRKKEGGQAMEEMQQNINNGGNLGEGGTGVLCSSLASFYKFEIISK